MRADARPIEDDILRLELVAVRKCGSPSERPITFKRWGGHHVHRPLRQAAQQPMEAGARRGSSIPMFLTGKGLKPLAPTFLWRSEPFNRAARAAFGDYGPHWPDETFPV